MQAFPRALMALAILASALTIAPAAQANDCISVKTATFDFIDGLRLIANAGRQIAIGIRSGSPGDGLAFVVFITPDVCSSAGLPPVSAGLDPDELPLNPPLIPLP